MWDDGLYSQLVLLLVLLPSGFWFLGDKDVKEEKEVKWKGQMVTGDGVKRKDPFCHSLICTCRVSD